MPKNKSPHDDIELGEEVARSAQGKRPAGIVVSVRLSAQEADQLQLLAQTSGKSLSEVAREALRASLNNAALHVLPAGFTATATNDTPLSLFGSLAPTTTAPMAVQHDAGRAMVAVE